LPPEEKQRLFAWCIASTLKPQLAIEDRTDPVIEAAGLRLNIGFEDFWRPAAANYWGRVKKAHGLEIGRQILGDRWARDHADDKKPVLAAALELAFDPQKSGGCINLSQTERDNAAAWLPPGMAYAARRDETSFEADAAAAAEPDTGTDDLTEIDPAATDLPAFLTEDEAAALNA
jgi:ParB family transcriptional regulator, chromosome partitioning protein